MSDASPATPPDRDRPLADLLALCRDLQAEVQRLREEQRQAFGRIAARDEAADAAAPELGRLRREIANQALDIESLRESVARLQSRAAEAERRAGHLEAYLALIRGTIGWRVLEGVRRVRDGLLPAHSRRGTAYRRLRGGLAALVGARRVDSSPAPASAVPRTHYDLWISREEVTGQALGVLARQVRGLTDTPTISLVTALGGSEPALVRKMLESVTAQVYPHWQLCVVDEAQADPSVRSLLAEHAKSDRRIVLAPPAAESPAAALNRAARLATGDFLAPIDADDELSANALFEVARRLNEDPELDLLYADEDALDREGRRIEPFFKPGWSPDLLLSMSYLGRLLVIRRAVFDAIGGFRPDLEGSHEHDLVLRVTEGTSRIAHIPKVLYHSRRALRPSAFVPAAQRAADDAALSALGEALARRGRDGSAETVAPGRYTVRYRVDGAPLVSIIIPTRDRLELLRRCIDSIEQRTDHSPFELIAIDNDSTDPGALAYLDSLRDRHLVCVRSEPFNFARLNNFAATRAGGRYLVFLNNDTQVIAKEWLSAMLELAQRPDVGAVGAKLLYPDHTIQHAGVVLGIGGVAGHAFKHVPNDGHAYFDLPHVIRNCSAVTAACMMVPRRVFDEVGGFDERLGVVFNDVDLCLRIRQRGYLIAYTPRAVLYHAESASRQSLHPPAEEALMWRLWGDAIRAGDPYYNPNLTRTHEDWSIGV